MFYAALDNLEISINQKSDKQLHYILENISVLPSSKCDTPYTPYGPRNNIKQEVPLLGSFPLQA
jgi:hypothetical protein